MEAFFEQLLTILLLLLILSICIFSYRMVEQKLKNEDSQPPVYQGERPLSRRNQEDNHEKDEH